MRIYKSPHTDSIRIVVVNRIFLENTPFIKMKLMMTDRNLNPFYGEKFRYYKVDKRFYKDWILERKEN